MTMHPLVPLLLLQVSVGWVWYLMTRSGRARPLKIGTINAILIGTGLALLAVWAARLVSGTLPPV